MRLENIREGMAVQLAAPPGHPLQDAPGTVIRVLTAEQLWEREPMTMLGEPFCWTGGQVLVSLDDPWPQDPAGRPWTPMVTVRPGDVQAGDGGEAREKMRELAAGFAADRHAFTETGLRTALEKAGFEVDRRTLHRWVTQDRERDREQAGMGGAP